MTTLTNRLLAIVIYLRNYGDDATYSKRITFLWFPSWMTQAVLRIEDTVAATLESTIGNSSLLKNRMMSNHYLLLLFESLTTIFVCQSKFCQIFIIFFHIHKFICASIFSLSKRWSCSPYFCFFRWSLQARKITKKDKRENYHVKNFENANLKTVLIHANKDNSRPLHVFLAFNRPVICQKDLHLASSACRWPVLITAPKTCTGMLYFILSDGGRIFFI